jgi:hypothetical protein
MSGQVTGTGIPADTMILPSWWFFGSISLPWFSMYQHWCTMYVQLNQFHPFCTFLRSITSSPTSILLNVLLMMMKLKRDCGIDFISRFLTTTKSVSYTSCKISSEANQSLILDSL